MAALGPIGIGALIFSGGLSIAQGVAARSDASKRADQVRKIGEIESGRTRREGRRALAQRAAGFGASGVTLAGTPTDVLADQAGEIEEIAILQQFGRNLQAADIRFQGNQAFLAGLVGGLSSFAQSTALASPSILGSGRQQALGRGMVVPRSSPAFPPASVPRGPIL